MMNIELKEATVEELIEAYEKRGQYVVINNGKVTDIGNEK